MAKTDVIRARIEPDRKAAGGDVLRRLGLSEAEYLNLCWQHLILHKSVPAVLRVPDADAPRDHTPQD